MGVPPWRRKAMPGEPVRVRAQACMDGKQTRKGTQHRIQKSCVFPSLVVSNNRKQVPRESKTVLDCWWQW